MKPVPSDIQRPDYADHPGGSISLAFSLFNRLHFIIRSDEQETNTRRAAAYRVTLSQDFHQTMLSSLLEAGTETEQLWAEREDHSAHYR